MTIRTTLDIKSFSGVGWGNKPEVKLSGGPNYHEIQLNTNLQPHEFRAELIVNGDSRINVAGTQLVMMERYKKHWDQPGKYIIALGDISGRTLVGQLVGGMETLPSDNIILRVHVIAKPATRPDSSPVPDQVVLAAKGYVSAHLPGDAGAAMAVYWPRLVEVTFAAGNTGRNIHDTLPQGPGMRLLRAHIFGDVSRVEFKKGPSAVGGNLVWERDADDNSFLLKRHGRAPQSGYFHVDFVESGFILDEMMKLDDAMRTVADLFVGTPGNIPILLETLELAPEMDKRVPTRSAS